MDYYSKNHLLWSLFWYYNKLKNHTGRNYVQNFGQNLVRLGKVRTKKNFDYSHFETWTPIRWYSFYSNVVNRHISKYSKSKYEQSFISSQSKQSLHFINLVRNGKIWASIPSCCKQIHCLLVISLSFIKKMLSKKIEPHRNYREVVKFLMYNFMSMNCYKA